MASQVKSVSAGAAGQFSEPLYLPAGMFMGVSIAGTFEGTVTVQRRYGGTGPWRAVKSFEAPVEEDAGPGAAAEFRIGIDTGDYSSGTAECVIWF